MRYRFARQSPNFPKPMVALNLMVDAPAHILAGLSNGSLERIGGVVRDVDTKQVVMWLRDTGATPANTLLGMTTAASLLHVGVAVVGFAIVIDKLNQIEKTLQSMQAQLKTIAHKIDSSFYANFRAAVNLAQNAFSMQRSDNRQVSAMAAINRFLEAQHIYTDLVDQQMPYKSAVIAVYLQTLYLAYLMEALGKEASSSGCIYFTGGASALLMGWRSSTIDVDMRLDPEPSGIFQSIAKLKQELNINIELASPQDFLPPLPGWRERSVFISQQGQISFYHYDFTAQALAKLSRGFDRDIQDVEAMYARNLFSLSKLRDCFEVIAPEIIRFPSLNVDVLRNKVENFIKHWE